MIVTVRKLNGKEAAADGVCKRALLLVRVHKADALARLILTFYPLSLLFNQPPAANMQICSLSLLVFIDTLCNLAWKV